MARKKRLGWTRAYALRRLEVFDGITENLRFETTGVLAFEIEGIHKMNIRVFYPNIPPRNAYGMPEDPFEQFYSIRKYNDNEPSWRAENKGNFSKKARRK